MTVTQLKEALERLEEEGHGEDEVHFWNEEETAGYLLPITRCDPLRGEDYVVFYSDGDDEENDEEEADHEN